MQYPVPQFIDRETKLIGPLTVRQVIIFGIDAAVLFVLYFVLNFFAFTAAVIVLTSTAIILAFVKINGNPMTKVMLSLFNYFLQPRIYLWGKEEEVIKKKSGGLLQNIVGGQKSAPLPKAPDEASKIPSVEEIQDVAKLLDE